MLKCSGKNQLQAATLASALQQQTLQNYKEATAHSTVSSHFDGLEVNMLKDLSLDDPTAASDSMKFNGISNGSVPTTAKTVTSSTGSKVSVLVGNSGNSNNTTGKAAQSSGKPKNGEYTFYSLLLFNIFWSTLKG